MDDLQIIVAVSTGILTILGYFVREVLLRIQNLESKVQESMTEGKTRTLLSDHLIPIKEDIKEIKDTLKQVFRLQVIQNNQTKHGDDNG
jgi:hypothetical protein